MRRPDARGPALVFTCEHGGAVVPRPYRGAFAGHERLLASHRGHDPGALELARALSRSLRGPLLASRVTRLLVDLNRDVANPEIFSDRIRRWGADLAAILARYYEPHRKAARRLVEEAIARRGAAVHVAVHTFTPVLRGVRRNVDVGLLFDPSRPFEREMAARWRRAIRVRAPKLRVRMNSPYRGTSDGLTTAIRRERGDATYAGIELEVNQRFPRTGGDAWARLRSVLAASLRDALEEVAGVVATPRARGAR